VQSAYCNIYCGKGCIFKLRVFFSQFFMNELFIKKFVVI